MLSERQKLILSAIVQDYVLSAEPIGSRALSKHHQIHFSAATIRNEMADLEELGYLDQPHTSAGRIPSQKGYRFYVDNLLAQDTLNIVNVGALRELFRQRIDEIERLLQQTATVLSQLTQYTSIVLGPKMSEETIRELQLIPLASGKAVAILVTNTGNVLNKHVRIPPDMDMDDVVQIMNLLNDKISDTPLSKVRSKMYRELSAELSAVMERYEGALEFLDGFTNIPDQNAKVYVDGTTNILAQPEFRDVEKVRPLLELLERAEAAEQLLPQQTGIQVRIGKENPFPTLQDCTVISADYTLSGVPVGRIGIVGPTRMDYSRVMQILNYTSGSLSRLFREFL
ncbi:heat-inducible transcriptional repressor HrcA [Alicyclobacillus sp. SO9]|uniref:heat-inducible transcriptional repressor HrcA n=1 Tax=Alicyclobacillus sp. SO9 TaxID=2665646 RepID=UPI0018E8F6DF|nr:heat-inducible transcriptional repressor HrcA [Alicyclobacillus sp. SO9]QQE77348.1 heat-inducible transcription repressor HrcA [Alicyclobacillus sp. SO9]